MLQLRRMNERTLSVLHRLACESKTLINKATAAARTVAGPLAPFSADGGSAVAGGRCVGPDGMRTRRSHGSTRLLTGGRRR